MAKMNQITGLPKAAHMNLMRYLADPTNTPEKKKNAIDAVQAHADKLNIPVTLGSLYQTAQQQPFGQPTGIEQTPMTTMGELADMGRDMGEVASGVQQKVLGDWAPATLPIAGSVVGGALGSALGPAGSAWGATIGGNLGNAMGEIAARELQPTSYEQLNPSLKKTPTKGVAENIVADTGLITANVAANEITKAVPMPTAFKLLLRMATGVGSGLLAHKMRGQPLKWDAPTVTAMGVGGAAAGLETISNLPQRVEAVSTELLTELKGLQRDPRLAPVAEILEGMNKAVFEPKGTIRAGLLSELHQEWGVKGRLGEILKDLESRFPAIYKAVFGETISTIDKPAGAMMKSSRPSGGRMANEIQDRARVVGTELMQGGKDLTGKNVIRLVTGIDDPAYDKLLHHADLAMGNNQYVVANQLKDRAGQILRNKQTDMSEAFGKVFNPLVKSKHRLSTKNLTALLTSLEEHNFGIVSKAPGEAAVRGTGKAMEKSALGYIIESLDGRPVPDAKIGEIKEMLGHIVETQGLTLGEATQAVKDLAGWVPNAEAGWVRGQIRNALLDMIDTVDDKVLGGQARAYRPMREAYRQASNDFGEMQKRIVKVDPSNLRQAVVGGKVSESEFGQVLGKMGLQDEYIQANHRFAGVTEGGKVPYKGFLTMEDVAQTIFNTPNSGEARRAWEVLRKFDTNGHFEEALVHEGLSRVARNAETAIEVGGKKHTIPDANALRRALGSKPGLAETDAGQLLLSTFSQVREKLDDPGAKRTINALNAISTAMDSDKPFDAWMGAMMKPGTEAEAIKVMRHMETLDPAGSARLVDRMRDYLAGSLLFPHGPGKNMSISNFTGALVNMNDETGKYLFSRSKLPWKVVKSLASRFNDVTSNLEHMVGRPDVPFRAAARQMSSFAQYIMAGVFKPVTRGVAGATGLGAGLTGAISLPAGVTAAALAFAGPSFIGRALLSDSDKFQTLFRLIQQTSVRGMEKIRGYSLGEESR